MLPSARAVDPRHRPSWALVLAAICLACALMPFRCSLNLGHTQRVWDDGFPLFGGVAAVLFALYALLRRRARLDGPGRVAVALSAVGAASAIYGYLTIKRVYPGPELGSAASRVDELLARGKIDDLIAAADPTVDATVLRQQLASISKRLLDHLPVHLEEHWEWGPDGLGVVRQVAEFDGAGTFLVRMSFRADRNALRLVSVDAVPTDGTIDM